MKYLLDTNTCIRFLNQRSTAIINKMKSVPDSDIAVCSVVKAELFYGAARSNNPTTTLAKQKYFLERFISLSFDDAAAEIYGSERGRLTALGTPIGPNDLLITSIALANKLILVTHNTREFGRIPELQIEDWELP
jgi:tRNA(fMet)-specific endonuclease VapC